MHARTRPVLVGDIGGTNVRFALATKDEYGEIDIDHFAKFPGDDFPDFETVAGTYLKQLGVEDAPDHALFALAGPVREDEVTLTNRSGWHVSGRTIAQHLGLSACWLVNDFAAMARAMPELPDEAFHLIHEGNPMPDAPLLVAGPGTGVGMATLIPLPGLGWHVLTGEGGHGCFAPGNARESALADWLRREKRVYVSRELVLSGSGLDTVMEALAAIDGIPFEPREPAAVLECAARGEPFCLGVVKLRSEALMQMLGDAALTNGARGGVIIVGGVAERLLDWLKRPQALERFFERGPMSHYMRDIPIRLIREPAAALYGAAALAFERLEGREV